MKSKISSFNILKNGFLMLAFSFLPFANAQAAELTDAQQIINETAEKLRSKLSDRSEALTFAEANAIVEELIDPNVDFPRMSALVLGKHWRTATPDQRTRFMEEFRNMLVRTYATAYTEFTDWSIRFKPIQDPEDGRVMVKSEILQPGRPPVAVDYRMVDKGDEGWKVYDVIIEGISLVTNYRTTFRNDVAKSGSLESVIESLAKRNEESITNNASDEPATDESEANNASGDAPAADESASEPEA